MSGYWGTVVVARPAGLLVDVDAVSGFGHAHAWLRELGGGWQMLETSGHDDPPDLRAPCGAVAAETGHPVLAAYVSDSHCAVTYAAIPGRVGRLTPLWAGGGPCGVHRHQPRDMPVPVGRDVGEVAAELAAWSSAAGLHPDTDALRTLVSRVGESADDLLFGVVGALGVHRIARTMPWTLPLYSPPFSGIVGGSGLAWLARTEAGYRRAMSRTGGTAEPEQPWEPMAIALESELWASLYRPGVNVAALARRASEVRTAYDGTPSRSYGSLPISEDEAAARDEADARAAVFTSG